MARNRNQATRLPSGAQRALPEDSLPDHADAPGDGTLKAGMQQLRQERADAGAEPKARMLGEALLRMESEQAKREKAGDGRRSAPRAGRTGGLGTRAERPSEGTTRRSADPALPDPGRRTKPPSPSSTGSRRPER